MKKKILLLIAVATLGLTTATKAQVNCNLINSATFSAPSQSITLSGNQAYVNNVVGQNFQMPLQLNQWNYIAFTKGSTPNAGPSTIYLNGQLIFAGNYTYNNFYNWTRFILGYAYGGTSSTAGQIIMPFKGLIDEVRLSNIVRTPNEILNNFQSNSPLNIDANTIGLWHLDQNSGTTVTSSVGQTGTASNVNWSTGVWGNCAEFNGVNSGIIFNQVIPTNNITCEFWIKPTSVLRSWPICYDGSLVSGYTSGFIIDTTLVNNSYTWSTGATGNSITVNPSTLPYIWVSDGNCKDTVWFNSQSATIYDTTLVTVTDTLLINTSVTGINPPNNLNTIRIFPNPASTHITIDYGNFAIMNGYQLKITNSLGQQMFQTAINQQSNYVSLASWGGNGLYFVHIIDPQGNTLDIRKIVLQ
jgi:hypothetical protein